MPRAQINLTPETYAAIAELAKQIGYIQKGGPRTGEGSPVKMLEGLVEADKAAPKDERILFRKIFRAYLNHGISGDTRANTSAEKTPPDQDAEK